MTTKHYTNNCMAKLYFHYANVHSLTDANVLCLCNMNIHIFKYAHTFTVSFHGFLQVTLY